MKTIPACKRLRMKTAIWGEMELVGHKGCRVLVEELSITGLSFRCDQETSLRLMPPRRQAPGTLLGVRVRVRFPLPGQQKVLELPTRVVFCRRYSQDSYRFDCEFDPRDTLQQQRVEAFLRRREGGEFEEKRDATSNVA